MIKIIAILIFISLLLFNSQIKSAENIIFTTLEKQIKINTDTNVSLTYLQSKLKSFLDGSTHDIIDGMKMILQEKHYLPYLTLNLQNFLIDGKDNEWRDIPNSISELQNIQSSETDVVSFKYFLDSNKLYLNYKIKNFSNIRNNIETFSIRIIPDNLAETVIEIDFQTNSKKAFLKIIKNRILKFSGITSIAYAIGDVFETEIPLKKLLVENNIPPVNKYFLKAGIKSINPQTRWYLMKNYIEAFIVHKNYALELFLHLLKNECYENNDSITISLALANNYLYSISDNATRNEIKRDIIKHYYLYKKIIKWQEKCSIKYSLRSVGVIPKIFWAYRVRTIDRVKWNEKLNLEKYQIFVDRIEILEKIHAEVVEHAFLNSANFHQAANSIESFVKSKNRYRCDIQSALAQMNAGSISAETYRQMLNENEQGLNERVFLGKKRKVDDFSWVNYLFNEYKQNKFYTGDCVSVTTMQMVFYKMAGIPSLSFQRSWIEPGTFSHNFPAHYNAFLKKWDCIQIPQFEKNHRFYLYFYKPIWHHIIYRYFFKMIGRKILETNYQGEECDSKKMEIFLRKGMDESHLKILFFSDETMKKGLIFNNESVPKFFLDTDRDGIFDIHEKRIGTNPQMIDSDNDGYSDLWEIEHGYNPNDPLSPPDSSILAIDGLSQRFTIKNNLPTIYSKMNNYIATEQIFDIKAFSYQIINNHLYLAVTYYNDIRKNHFSVHSFSIYTKGDVEHEFWLQWYNGNPNLYLKEKKIDNTNKYIQIGKKGLIMSQLLDAEFLVPLTYFKRANTLYIRYHAGGKKNNRVIIVSDTTGSLRINLQNDTLFPKIISQLTLQNMETDPQTDFVGSSEIFDIKNFKYFSLNNQLVFYTNYHNDVRTNDFGNHTFEIINPLTRKRWRLEFVQAYSCIMRIYQNETVQRVILKRNAFDVYRYKGGFLFTIDKTIFGNPLKLKIQYYVSSRDSSGKIIFRGDETRFLEIDTR